MPLTKTTIPKKEVIEKIEDFNDNFDPNTGWLLLIYGPFGSGKTWFCGTARDSLYINTGSGEDTLRSPLFLSRHSDIKRKEKRIVNTPQKMGFDQVCDVMETFLSSEELLSTIKTVIIDDATSLRSMAVLHGMKAAGKNIRDFKLDMSDVKREMDRINWFFEYHLPIFKSMGINFILTAHEARIYGKQQKQGDERPLLEIRPGFAGEKFADAIPSKFDEVWYTKLVSDKGVPGSNNYYQQIKTGKGGIEITRSRRAGVFPTFIKDSNFEELLEMRRKNELHISFQKK